MQSEIRKMLWRRDAKGVNQLVSRGATLELFGFEVVYVGPTPDYTAYFWLGPGNVQTLDRDQMRDNGLTFAEEWKE